MNELLIRELLHDIDNQYNELKKLMRMIREDMSNIIVLNNHIVDILEYMENEKNDIDENKN